MDNQMFCFQCEQTAGCTGCTGRAGVCGKSAATAKLQDKLTGALVGLARVCTSNPRTETSDRLVLEGLFTTITNVNFNDETIAALSASDSADALADAAKAQGQRLSALFSDLHQGTPLPAHGVESLCRYCEMSGLCRREYLG